MATQEKTWNVANRLHSQKDSDNPEVNHIIAGADEIYDDAKGAKQSDINAQADAALEDRYTKAETYSKEQLDALITTPDANYVSVVATNATTAVTDILPAPGEANTIYRVGNWNGTQYDPTMYALFAWNGTTYVCLAVRSFVGEVYDVSVNHPDGQGNPTPYADLTAALGTDGENIPADIRRGGMRIQFIKGNAQSSDNKYIQARLMSDTFSTTESDWQGVDDEPTAGSENLVKSAGMYDAIEKAVPYIIASNIPNESYSYKKVFVKQGHHYRIQKTANFSYSGGVLLILRVDKSSTGQTTINLTSGNSFIDFTADKDYNYLLIYFGTPLTESSVEVTLIDKEELLLSYTQFAGGNFVKDTNILTTPLAANSNLVDSKGIFNADDTLLMLINNIENYLLGDNGCQSGAVIGSDNKWRLVNGKFFIVKVREGDVVELHSQFNINVYAFLNTYIYPSADGEVPDFTTGYTQRQTDSHATTTLNIPQGCNYLYVLRTSSGNIYCDSITVNGYKYGSLSQEPTLRKKADDAILESLYGKHINQPTEYQNRYMNTDGTWYNGVNYSTYVDISNFKGQKITSTSNVAQYAFLSDVDETTGGTFCVGYSRTSGYPNNETIPSDCKYIYLYVGLHIPSKGVVLSVTGEIVGSIEEAKLPRLMVKKESSVMYIYQYVPSLKKYIEYPMHHYSTAYVAEQYPSYYDIWRLEYPAICHLDGEKMVREQVLFRSGEAELAINVPSSEDGTTNVYVGGSFHGFENVIVNDSVRSIQMLIDNQAIGESDTLDLSVAHKVEIYQETELCQAYSNSNPFARALKHWVWREDSDYQCSTKVMILRQIAFAQAQFGMMCVFRHVDGDTSKPYLVNKGIKQNNPFKVYTLEDGWDDLPENSGIHNKDYDCKRIILYGQESLGFSMQISGDTIKPNGGMFVGTNGSTYNKIYFDLTGSYTPEVGEELKATQSWMIQ